MKILTAEQTQALDAYTIQEEPIASIDLMERASSVFFNWFMEQFPLSKSTQSIHVFCGMGNNGGDGLVIARLLQAQKYDVQVSICHFTENGSEDFQTNLKRLEKIKSVKINAIHAGDDLPELDPENIVIDAVFGSGLNRPVVGYWADLLERLNQYAETIVAVDMPSGLFADQATNSTTIKAHHTFTFELPKLAFLFPENQETVGDWNYRSIGLSTAGLAELASDNYFIDLAVAKGLFHQRNKFDHKGTFGHALLVAGSYGKLGAAILSAKAALRSGLGLLTIHAPQCAYEILQISIPEAMVSIDRHKHFISEWPKLEKYQVVGLGPGIDQKKTTVEAVLGLIQSASYPLVIDADGLNILAKHPELFSQLPPNSILTPHPKEFERLFGKSKNDFERNQLQRALAKKYGIVLILKGAHTCVALPDGNCYFNSTGNPGMATAGSGDVLTGIITGLLAQQYSAKEAAIIGVFLHGLAGDLAAEEMEHHSLIASDLIAYLGKAFMELKHGR